jgi:hypothetical protein
MKGRVAITHPFNLLARHVGASVAGRYGWPYAAMNRKYIAGSKEQAPGRVQHLHDYPLGNVAVPSSALGPARYQLLQEALGRTSGLPSFP